MRKNRKLSLLDVIVMKARRSGAFKKIVVGFLFLSVLMALSGAALLYVLILKSPAIDALKDYRPNTITRVYADNNELVDTFFMEDRRIISIKDVPEMVIKAFVASEDARFFHHQGLDIIGIFRAFFKNMIAGEIVQGGSTITQQVAKSLYLSPERTIIRKVKEAILAYKIDRYLTKSEILDLYLNHIYLGHGAYGIEAAAQIYFGKNTRDLSLAEVAMLAGLPKAPNRYSPYVSMERARQRQQYVLTRMAEDGYISEIQKERALKTRILLISTKPKEKVAPYFTENVRRYILEKYGSDALYKEGLEIYTTLNVEMQKAATAAVERGLAEMETREKFEAGRLQGALICMDVRTGEIKAMVGGRDYKRSEFNRATQAKRRPGSSFKPFIYTAAFDKGLTPATIIIDSPVVFDDVSRGTTWKPQNFEQKFFGPTTLRTALTYSRNVVTVKLLKEIGVGYAIDYAANMGLTSPLTRDLSLALGTSVVTLQDMIRGYSVLANQGKKAEPFFIKKIVDRNNHTLEEQMPAVEQVIDPRVAFLTTSVLQDVVQEGTGERVKAIGRPVAGKTGTTDDYRDAWFIGYTPSLIAGVWVGFDDERSMGRSGVGGVAAAPIWLYFMEKALAGQPVEVFPTPEGIVFTRINPRTGLLAGPFAKDAVFECFLEGTAPKDYSTEDADRSLR
jgi:penicillin-binding protein 1A